MVSSLEEVSKQVEIAKKQHQSLVNQKQQLCTFLSSKSEELQDLGKEIEEYNAHKIEMEQQFQQI